MTRSSPSVPFFAGMPERAGGADRRLRRERAASTRARCSSARATRPTRSTSSGTARVAIEVHAPTRGSLTIETIEPGEVVGWSWLFPPYRWHFDARAVSPVRATGFDGACLRGKCDDDPALGYDLMRRFAQVFIDRLQCDAAAAARRLWRRRLSYVPAAGRWLRCPIVVRERVQETADTWTLTLEPIAGEEPAVAPGQFMMVYVFGIGEVPISVSGAVGRAAPLVLTVRRVGAVTSAICASEAGAVLGVRGPVRHRLAGRGGRGRRRRRRRRRDRARAAAGRVLLHVLEQRADYGALVLLYGARTPGDLLYRDELERWRAAAAVDVTVDAADADWHGKVGVVPKLVPARALRRRRRRPRSCAAPRS